MIDTLITALIGLEACVLLVLIVFLIFGVRSIWLERETLREIIYGSDSDEVDEDDSKYDCEDTNCDSCPFPVCNERDKKRHIKSTLRWQINSDGYYPYCPVCGEEPESREMTDRCPNCDAKLEKYN